jgi:hypothetical protein
MEQLLGPDMIQTMLRGYLATFSQMAIDEADFRAYYEGFVTDNFGENATDIITMTEWDTWVKAPGAPPQESFNFTAPALEEAKALAIAYVKLNGAASPDNYEDYFGYISKVKYAFVQTLEAMIEDIDVELLAYIDGDLNTTSSIDPRLKTLWYQVGIRLGYSAVFEPARLWMSEMGRYVYVTDIFTALVESGNCDLALDWYAENVELYTIYVAAKVASTMEECLDDTSPMDPTLAPSSFSSDVVDTSDGIATLAPVIDTSDGIVTHGLSVFHAVSVCAILFFGY